MSKHIIAGFATCFLVIIFCSSGFAIQTNEMFSEEIKVENIIDESLFSTVSTTDVFTITFDGEQRQYSLEDLQSFETVTGSGGRLKVTGSVSGPYDYTGVSISSLLEEFQSAPSSVDLVSISDDGYIFKFTHDQIQGNVMIYDEEGNEIGMGGVDMILAYAEDGEPLTHGGPFRIAWVNDNDAITDAFLWPKYLEEIEFLHPSSDETSPSMNIDRPDDAIYLFDSELVSYVMPLIIGDITIEVSAEDNANDIAKSMIVIDEKIKTKQIGGSLRWNWDEHVLGSKTIQIIAYDTAGNVETIDKTVMIYNPF